MRPIIFIDFVSNSNCLYIMDGCNHIKITPLHHRIKHRNILPMRHYSKSTSHEAENSFCVFLRVQPRFWTILFLFLLMQFGQSNTGNCVDLLDNTAFPVTNSTFLYSNGNARIGVSFTTGAIGYQINSIKFLPVGFTQTTADYTVSLYMADTSFLPTGTSITSQSLTALNAVAYSTATTINAATLITDNSWLILPNTNYSIIFSSTGNSYIGAVNPLNTPPATGSSGITFRGQVYRYNSTTPWASAGTNNIPWIKVTGSVVAVPEPTTLLLGFVAAVFIVLKPSRKHSKRKVW